jgi:hypothetical protein
MSLVPSCFKKPRAKLCKPLVEGAFVQDKGEVEMSGIIAFFHAELTLGVDFVAVRVDL